MVSALSVDDTGEDRLAGTNQESSVPQLSASRRRGRPAPSCSPGTGRRTGRSLIRLLELCGRLAQRVLGWYDAGVVEVPENAPRIVMVEYFMGLYGDGAAVARDERCS